MTDAMDGSSLAVTAMGSPLHEDIQKGRGRTLARRMTFEGKGIVRDLISGHSRHRRPRGR